MIKIGLLGFGTVGSGVYEILTTRKDELNNILREDIEIVNILVNDINKERDVILPEGCLTDDYTKILDNPEIDIVVEAIGGVELPYKIICAALKNGKHVVSANKAVISKHIDEFVNLANKNNSCLLFEASVGGGIPIIKPLTQSIAINEISEIKGILNGTTNFILSKMSDENLSFKDALGLAFDLGYAEADPTDDVEGYDVRRKIAILSSIAFKRKVLEDDIFCRGISSISKLDMEYFKKLGFSVKLLGHSINHGDSFSASVEPVLLRSNSMLASVKDSYNIVSIQGSTVGELQFYGAGAGKNPTGNAVVSDIIDIIKGDYSPLDLKSKDSIKPGVSLFKGEYYLRLPMDNKDKLFPILDLFHNRNIPFNVIKEDNDVVILTKSVDEDFMNYIINILDRTYNDYCCIRIEGQLYDLSISDNISLSI